jgi:hypothetical protein
MMSDRVISWIVNELNEKIMAERRENSVPDYVPFENERIKAFQEALELVENTAEEDIPEDYIY